MLIVACSPSTPTEVLVIVDAEPALTAEATGLRVRVLDHERDDVVLDASRPLRDLPDALPAVVPLVPRDGDATRSFLVEATLVNATGAVIAIGRLSARYVEGEVREVLLCLEDVCRGELCGDTDADCDTVDSARCATCRAPDRACDGVMAETLPRGAGPAACGPPTCVPAGVGVPETSCADAVDDDCDTATDCEDTDCDGRSCGARGEVCRGGACECETSEGDPRSCADGTSNDCDDDVDCADPDCAGVSCDATGRICNFGTRSCAACPGGELAESRCQNGADDDCDGFVDCADPDCCSAFACEGQTCRDDPLRRCCDGECVFMDRRDHCGGCRSPCGTRPDGLPYECVRIRDLVEPRFACRCNGADDATCAGDQRCLSPDDQLLCQCNSDDDCAARGMRCVQTGAMSQSYCE
jgi:hypothetical protein